MARAYHRGPARRRVERATHCRRERTGPEDTSEIVVHRLHDFHRLGVFHAAMVKQQFRQGGKQGGGSPMSGGIRNPEQSFAIAHAQRAINIPADLDHGSDSTPRYPVPAGPVAFGE